MKNSLLSKLRLDLQEARKIRSISTVLFKKLCQSGRDFKQSEISEFSKLLPTQIKEFFHKNIRSGKNFFIVDGLEVNEERLGPTPEHWTNRRLPYSNLLQFEHCIISALCGVPGGYDTNQGGHVVTDIFPMKGYQGYQQSFGSKAELVFHTEDAFDAGRASYLSLMCLRNPDRIPTTVFPINLVSLPSKVKDELFQQQFSLQIDDPHTGIIDQLESNSIRLIHNDVQKKYKIALLEGSYASPSIRIDPVNIDVSGLSLSAQRAFGILCEKISESKIEIFMKPGQLLFVNNKKVPHGRGGFTARYDGMDRWLTRVLLFDQVKNPVFKLRKE